MAGEGFFTKVVGVSHNNEDGTSRQAIVRCCREGESLLLQREPNNQFDANAVRVLRQNGEQLGYLPAHVVGTGIASDLDGGRTFHVIVDAITGRDKEMLGVNPRSLRWMILPKRSLRQLSPLAGLRRSFGLPPSCCWL